MIKEPLNTNYLFKSNAIHTLSVQNIRNTVSFHETDQMNPGDSYDPLLMSLVKSTSIRVDEGEETV